MKVKVHSRLALICSISLILMVTSCRNQSKNDAAEELMIKGKAQGTTYTVKYLGDKMPDLPAALDTLLDEIDQSLSTYDSTSLISRFNRGDTIKTDLYFREMLSFSKRLSAETSGAFDPTIGPLIKAWGWDVSKAEEMDSSKVDSLLKWKGFDYIVLDLNQAHLKRPSCHLNFNAIAQGYAVDLMSELLEGRNIKDYYVELGGELKVSGVNGRGEVWKIGIDRPDSRNLDRELIAILPLKNAALATSGNYRKFYEKDGVRYSHTIDPQSGFPVNHSLLSATVISEEAYRADALATAFMVMGLEKSKTFLSNHPEDHAFLIYSDSSGNFDYYVSPAIEEKLEKIER